MFSFCKTSQLSWTEPTSPCPSHTNMTSETAHVLVVSMRSFVLERHLLLTRSSLCFSDAGTDARWLLLEGDNKTYREKYRRKLPSSGPGTRLRYWCHNVSSDEVQWIMYVRDQDIETCCYHKLILTWVICVLAVFCPEVAGQCAPPLM